MFSVCWTPSGHLRLAFDKIPSWFLRIAAPLISVPTAYIFNTSLSFSVVPDQWKSSSITPVPKITSPLTCQDFRPISVTPVLSRLFEKEFVRQIIYPVLVHPNYTQQFSDQFAFRPTGSTTGALTQLLHTVTDMLQTEPYVHVIALDFSKAFDTGKAPDSPPPNSRIYPFQTVPTTGF